MSGQVSLRRRRAAAEGNTPVQTQLRMPPVRKLRANTMHWLLTPIDRHSDDGFGAMATAFRASAETLLAAERDSMAQRELPTCFLLRHAAELFLKSTLVVTHRAFKPGLQGYPAIQVDGKAKPMTSVHGAGAGSVDRQCRSRLNHFTGADRGQDPVAGHLCFRPRADIGSDRTC